MYPTRTTFTTGTMAVPPVTPAPTPPRPATPGPLPVARATAPAAPRAGLHTLAAPLPPPTATAPGRWSMTPPLPPGPTPEDTPAPATATAYGFTPVAASPIGPPATARPREPRVEERHPTGRPRYAAAAPPVFPADAPVTARPQAARADEAVPARRPYVADPGPFTARPAGSPEPTDPPLAPSGAGLPGPGTGAFATARPGAPGADEAPAAVPAAPAPPAATCAAPEPELEREPEPEPVRTAPEAEGAGDLARGDVPAARVEVGVEAAPAMAGLGRTAEPDAVWPPAPGAARTVRGPGITSGGAGDPGARFVDPPTPRTASEGAYPWTESGPELDLRAEEAYLWADGGPGPGHESAPATAPAPDPATATAPAAPGTTYPRTGPGSEQGDDGAAPAAEPWDAYPWTDPGTGPGDAQGAPAPHGVAHVVAQAVARGMEDDTQDLPRVSLPGPAGAGVAEVPAGLPFRAAGAAAARGPARPRPSLGAGPTGGAKATASASALTSASAPGRRVPRGDDRLREVRGPVLPGSVGLLIGALALAGCAAVLWRAGALPPALVAAFGATPHPYEGLRSYQWPPLAFLGVVALFALGGLGRGRTGHAWVLTLFGRYRGTVRRSGLLWVSPLLLRRRVDVRLRHWRSDPLPAVDSGGLALQVVVQVVWQIKDTARAALAVEDHSDYLAEQVESAMARVLSQLPADAFHEDAPTLRDAEAVGDALTRMLAAETEAVGIEVYSAQPTRIEYAPEVAAAMRRRRVAAIDAKHRDSVLTSVVDAVDDTVNRLTSRGLVELDDYERKALVKDLTVAFYTGRPE
ncbi:SPFH domain-containing protein [Streptomyces sp. G-G2]|uniref:SPFH domain-containing protein n=1 Tax=Streptomyces sp. G-G2 TaxID=3046201 RepID=UPI0024BAD13C|nr:SPFH domain-containing protein [Streptomyces sp. G-G2]MDJ0379668.1 SPFH domain-containing protein [Streptomyces sp. G-G2]